MYHVKNCEDDLLPCRPTHDAEVFHISCSLYLRGELVVGELSVDDLFVTGAYEATLLVQEHSRRAAKRKGRLVLRTKSGSADNCRHVHAADVCSCA